ncbi:MAG: VOC family protein [Methanomassiliicoccales archaeon]
MTDEEGPWAVGPGSIPLLVSDMDRALHFYIEILGMRLIVDARKHHWVELGSAHDVGRIALTLERDDQLVKPCSTGVVLVMEDIGGMLEQASQKGVVFTLLPQRRAWGGLVAKLLDPDHNEITILDRNLIGRWSMSA